MKISMLLVIKTTNLDLNFLLLEGNPLVHSLKFLNILVKQVKSARRKSNFLSQWFPGCDETGEGDEEQNVSSSLSIAETSSSSSLYQRLKAAVRDVTMPESRQQQDENLKKEFEYFDRYKKRTPKLDNLFDALCSVQATSTQSERNFSLASNFVSKLRTRLKDVHVDALTFLKSFFM